MMAYPEITFKDFATLARNRAAIQRNRRRMKLRAGDHYGA